LARIIGVGARVRQLAVRLSAVATIGEAVATKWAIGFARARLAVANAAPLRSVGELEFRAKMATPAAELVSAPTELSRSAGC
jgi:hypothetical protein